jgi:hypothetical protein
MAVAQKKIEKKKKKTHHLMLSIKSSYFDLINIHTHEIFIKAQ